MAFPQAQLSNRDRISVGGSLRCLFSSWLAALYAGRLSDPEEGRIVLEAGAGTIEPLGVAFEPASLAAAELHAVDHLIANVNIVPYSGDEWIMIRLQDGSWEIPGGTLEEENDGPLACQPIITPERHNTRPC